MHHRKRCYHFKFVVVLGLTICGLAPNAAAHDAKGDHQGHRRNSGFSHVLIVAKGGVRAAMTAANRDSSQTTGQDPMVFSWDEKLTGAFPKEAKEYEPGMHGGFNEDPETGVVYTGIPGYGLCSISPNLQTWQKLGNDERLEANIHGIVFFKHAGRKRIAVAQNNAQRVLILDTKGNVLQELVKPGGGEFNFEEANKYYGNPQAKFAVTDVTYFNGTLYAVTGYSPGDFVLTAREKNGKWSWGELAWGGKGEKPGQFKTAHGIYAHENHIYVANREAHQVVKFTKEGQLVELIKDIPAGSRICNVAYLHDHFFFCPLAKIGDQKSAPVYAHTGEELVSTIIPGELGIPVLNNIHHVWPHYVTSSDGSKQLYLLIHGWNQGKYAVLKHVPK